MKKFVVVIDGEYKGTLEESTKEMAELYAIDKYADSICESTIFDVYEEIEL